VADLILFLFTDSDNTSFLNNWLSFLPLIEETLEQHPEFRLTAVEAKVTLSMFKALTFKQTDMRSFQTLEERVYEYFNRSDHPDMNYRLQTGMYLVVHNLWAGNFVAAKDVVLRLAEISKAESVSDFMRISIKSAETLYEILMGTCNTALEKVSEALALSQKSGVYVWDNHMMIHGAAAALSTGDLACADNLFRKVASNLEYLSPMDKVYFYGMLSWKAKIEGNLDIAHNHLKHMYLLFNLLLQTTERVVGHIFIADILLMKGEEHEALEHLEIAKDIALKNNSRLITFMCLLLEVRLCLDHGNEEKGLALLRTAMKIGRESTIMNFYGWHAPDMLRLCIKALEAGIEVDYVRMLIVARNLVPAIPPLNLDNWPWQVQVVTLGRFEVLVNNQPVKSSRKPSYKQMEMLKVLVSLGGIETSEEKIRDLLWPDSEGDTARDLFKVTLHRLRKLLGNDQVIRFKDGRIALDRRYVWVDAWAFEHHIGNAKELGNRGEGDNSEASLQKGTALYGGRFLESEVEMSWQFTMRNRLHQKYLAAVMMLAEHFENAGAMHTAIGICTDALDKDPLAEQLYQRLMTYYFSAGRPVDVASTYRRCINTLAASGLAHSPGMETAFQRMSV
jgi:DNA-binding SARP family transcriptional activator/tetratricopeptide (TPR) repeat protein